MANPEKGKASKVPSRAASLQRMLEMERKQKMERMQQNPYATGSGRRSESPAASQPKSNLLTRRRDTSQPPDDHHRMSTVRNYSLPPPTHSKPPHSTSRHQDRTAKQTHSRKMAPVEETRKSSADRDGLPSMKRAAAEQGSPQVKTVTFLHSDDGQSDTSSICHSPTWDDYGKRRKEKEGTAREAKSSKRRLTKEPPPAAMDNRPGLNPRIMSAPLLDRTSSEDNRPSDHSHAERKSRSSRPQPLPSQSGSVESVQTVSRSPAFIGGVRLERERDAARRRLKDSRAPSVERSGSEMLQQNQASQPPSTEQPKRRETAPPVSYPPIASKTPFLKHTSSTKEKGHSRKRSGSFTGVVSKLFGSSKSSQDPQPPLERRDSEDSVQTVRSLLSLSKGSRGRGRSGSATPQSQSRTQSRENHSRSNSTPLDERRGGMSLPPLSWKNSRKKKTTSMVAIPPDSARRGSFSPDISAVEQDKFSFLERPFSPPGDGPLSPTASLSASMKAKMSPQTNPERDARPGSPPPKKTFKETIKAGFRSSVSTESRPSHPRMETDDSFIIEVETPPILSSESHPLQSHPVIRPRTSDRPPSSSRGPRRSDEHHSSRRPHGTAETKDSGASTSSSHPDSESPPPSPATTPDTSRPQSSKDNNNHPRAEDLRKLPLLSLHVTNTPAVQHPYAAILGSSSHFSTQANAERPKGGPKELVSQQTVHRSNFIEDLPGQAPLTDELWSRRKPPPDTDQLSFTSALTSLDVKRSVQDLGLPNSEIALFSMDRDFDDPTKATKVTLKRIQVEVTKSPAYAKKHAEVSPVSPVSTTDTSFLPSPPHQALPPPRASGRSGQQALLPPLEVDRRSSTSHAHNDSLDSFLSPPPTAASTYLQEARKAAPASPRGPTAKTSSSPTTGNTTTNPLPSNSNSSPAPRAFALAQPKAAAAAPILQQPQPQTLPPHLPSGGPAVPNNPRHSSLDTTGLKPIAKMFVECCHCKFYQDMPSRVYEAMARPEDTVRDKRLGVSGQVTTCVKCPWCSHNMSTQCCAGFAAVVYLREKLHGP
ncbi:hypothetical protein VMCG_03379 [Cytospora schulzeri]|uniref:Uncharacterized protein n=1 Tax=Cytospora schulzeri TaxID=448051 RepID=A0A423WWF2_9PEZI|nr:hypothetical protein VMCG_03379 [Valsa malicola]